MGTQATGWPSVVQRHCTSSAVLCHGLGWPDFKAIQAAAMLQLQQPRARLPATSALTGHVSAHAQVLCLQACSCWQCQTAEIQ